MRHAQLLWCVGIVATLGCGATSRRGTSDGSPPDDTANGGATNGGATNGGAASDAGACALPPATLTRLSFPEQVLSARLLFGDELGDELELTLGASSPAFPPLTAPHEGAVINDSIFAKSDELAQRIGSFARESFELTGCSEADFECVRQYVLSLGERAFRRPLSDEEQGSLLLPIETAEALATTAATALEYGVYAVFESPHFLYRSELGFAGAEPEAAERPLTDYELASLISYYLTGGPPDDELLRAASEGALSGEEQLAAHAERLLSLPMARQHIERQLGSYVGVPQLETQVLDPALYPDDTLALRTGMRVELEALIADAAWSSGVGVLLTTRSARVNADLATVYGLTFPPAGASPDASGFAEVELPPTRAGLLTRAGWAMLGARPDGPSVISRGLRMMDKVLCYEAQPFPDDLPTIPGADAETERARAEIRMTNESCSECHLDIDPLGLALDDLDAIGKYREVDSQGHAIDAAVTLPAFAGGATVNGALELSQAIPEQSLATCLSQRFLEYAVDPARARATDHCQRDAFAQERSQTGEQSLTALITQIVRSRSFRLRKP
jgi:hypothetical protein